MSNFRHIMEFLGPCILISLSVRLSVHQQINVDADVARLLNLPHTDWVCEVSMSSICHGHRLLVLWSLISAQWPWPWDSCGRCCVQGIAAKVASCLWIIHEGWMCMGVELWSCDLWHWSHVRNLGILVDAAVSKVLMPNWSICVCGLPMKDECA